MLADVIAMTRIAACRQAQGGWAPAVRFDGLALYAKLISRSMVCEIPETFQKIIEFASGWARR
jgi:hypothetical protein